MVNAVASTTRATFFIGLWSFCRRTMFAMDESYDMFSQQKSRTDVASVTVASDDKSSPWKKATNTKVTTRLQSNIRARSGTHVAAHRGRGGTL
jgi:hypothetical protein